MHFKHIRSKIAFFLFSATVISLLLCWLVNFIYFSTTISNQLITDSRVMAQKVADRLENDLEYVRDYVSTMSYDESLTKELNRFYIQTGFDKYSAENRLVSTASNYLVLGKNLFSNIYFVNYMDTQDISGRGKFNSLLKEDWYQQFKKQEGFTMVHNSILRNASHVRFSTVSYVKAIYNNEIHRIGSIVADMNLARLFKDLHTAGENAQAYYVVDDTGEAVYPYAMESSVLKKFNPLQELQLINDNYYISVPIKTLNYKLISVLPKIQIDKAMFGSTFVMFLSLILGLFIAGGFTLVLSKSITKPILRLGKGMQESIGQNFNISLPVYTKDELGKMTEIFNKMQGETRELIIINKQMGKKDRELRMKYFMCKINPHFIYNTLNCLIYLARKNQGNEIISLTKALIAILKTNIKVGELPIPLRDEVEYLQNYFHILKYRYNDEIKINFDIDEDLLCLYIQPMILYPLVENSVFHGIAPAEKKGTVTISVKELESSLVFSVQDDGIGIEDEKIAEIREYLRSENERNIYGSIGLKNANDRLRLFYPSCTGLEIFSDKITRVSFSIDKKDLRQTP